ncbi:MAG TPA: AAA family ATPase [Syntrophorhabdaceae bacterium]|nr:AAA family ATPase [Syntrophorhabdaceae bacterium]
MRLKRLELFGFKSFLNRTVFHFNEGITSIVGPNGCGKSNIVDAIVWALGERGTKSLRIKDMGDVIFHGSNGKRPVNIAEVCIDFTEHDQEISIKRRIYRDGTNEYFINNTQVRLKDVQDFFLGTGIGPNSYAIIEQGRIEYFIQMKPQERRVIIEETSGITRFEEKKRDAIMRMEEVKSNLERIDDIYCEVKQSFEKATQEYERWKIYKVLSEKQKDIEKQILMDGYIKIDKRLNKVKEKIESTEQELKEKEEIKVEYKKSLDLKEQEFTFTDNILRELELDIKGKEKDMEKRLLELEYLEGEKRRLENILFELKEKKKSLDRKSMDLNAEIEALKKKIEDNTNLILKDEEEEKKIKDTIDTLKLQIDNTEKQMEEERTELFVIMGRITEINNQLLEIERKRLEKVKREEKRAQEKERILNRLNELENELSKTKARQENEIAEKDRLSIKEKSIFADLKDMKRTMDALRQKIDALNIEKRGKEAFLKQMSTLNAAKDRMSKLKKLIDLINIDEWTEKAVERFFYKEMEYSVLHSNNIEEMADIISKYNENFIFFHDKSLFNFSGDENEGRVGINIRWIDSVEETLKKIKAGEEGIFLNNEIYIDSRGIILKEKDASKIDLQQYRERKKAEKEIKELQIVLEKHTGSLNQLRKELEAKEKEHKEVITSLRNKEDALKRYELAIAKFQTEIKTVKERLNELESYIDIFDEDLSESKVQGLKDEKESHMENKKVFEEKLDNLKRELDTLKNAYETVMSGWRSVSIELERKKNTVKAAKEDIERKGSQILHIKAEMEEIESRLTDTEKKIVECIANIEKLEKDYEEIKFNTKKHIERYEDLKNRAATLHMERKAISEKIDTISKEIEKIRDRKESAEKDIAVLTEKKNVIEERLSAFLNMEDIYRIPLAPISELEAERERIEEQIKELGEVNFRAEKEYLETKERLEFLETQKKDLKDAMDSLKKTISKIEGITKEMFFETFETVNNAFKRFTDMLFKGGNGQLVYNHDSLGVDMFVQLPGKRIARMEQLSGGEKALISIAFLLSLMDTNPSPFSILDEIDAPLDDSNIISLLEIIKTIVHKTQIIFITHNRLTMEASNTIYGVTMEEPGISKIVSVRL